MESFSVRFWRGLVRSYVRWSPIARGKHRLMETLAPRYSRSALQICELPGGARIQVDLGEHVQRWIYFFGVYEKNTVQWFCETVRPGMVVLDVGAHVGQYSLLAASKVGSQGRVHSFEPNPVIFARLSANIELNGFAHVAAHPLAMSDLSGVAYLSVPEHDNQGEATLQAAPPGARQVHVRCATIDEWARTADLGNPPRIDLIKIDVQGFEGKVLKGAQEVLERFRPVVICEFEERFLQTMGTSSVALKAELINKGYTIYRLSPTGLSAVRHDEVHYFDNLVLVPGAHVDVGVGSSPYRTPSDTAQRAGAQQR